MRIAQLVTLAFAAVVSTSLARGGVIVVAAGGGGGFTDLPAAVAAASDGDVLLVKNGSYSGFTITNKALDIVADAGAEVNIAGTVIVTTLSAARSVTITGVDVLGPGHAVMILNCAGAVRLQGCTLRPQTAPNTCVGYGSALGLLVDTSSVCVSRCTVEGARGAEPDRGGDAIFARRSECALYESTLRGGRGGDLPGPCFGNGYAGDGGRGLLASDMSFVLTSGCTIEGGRGGDLTGSIGYAGGCGGSGWYINTAPAGRLLDTLVVGGLAGTPNIGAGCQPQAQAVEGTPVPIPLGPGPARTLTAPRVVREHNALRIDATGVPGEAVELVISTQPDFTYSDVWRGVRLVKWKPSPLAVMRLGTIAGNGQLHVLLPLGDLGAGVTATRLFLQAMHEGNGAPTIGPVSIVVVLDSAF